MWHPVKYVAESYRIVPSELEGFAIVYADKYGIVFENGYAEVNTFHCDDLVKDYKEFSARVYANLACANTTPS
jgi:hypothetical protein